MTGGVLLLLTGPLQSWGEASTFTRRDTLAHPTRSGVLGLIASALGRSRDQDPADLDALTLNIRCDRPGTLLRDYHTVGGWHPHGVPTPNGQPRSNGHGTVLTERWYLSDASFVVAINGPDDLTTSIAAALAAPRWAPHLGRRSCPPAAPVLLTPTTGPASGLLPQIPVHRTAAPGQATVTVATITETDDPALAGATLRDVPVSYTALNRRHRTRKVIYESVDYPAAACTGRGTAALRHLYATARTLAGRTATP